MEKTQNRKNILGLDLGTNSIGFALIQTSDSTTVKDGSILMSGSRVIPMDATIMGNFEKGNSQSQTAERTTYRGMRHINERRIQRRERLHRVLHILGYLPQDYAGDIDFDSHPGQILDNHEPKLAWYRNDEGKPVFRFMDAFHEMMNDFAKSQPKLVADGLKVPYDWTIYYLRKKALTQKISGGELAWLLLQFNQKRGYYQLRGEDEEEEQPTKTVEYYSLKVTDVVATDERRGNDRWYDVHLENGWIYHRPSSQPLDWVGKMKDFIVTTDINPDGTPKLNKYGEPKRSFRAPSPDDWTLMKKKTEKDIDDSGDTVGCFIYDTLLTNPKQKIIGGLIRTIERKKYKDELTRILECQVQFHPELQNKDIYNKCIDELYPSNEAHKSNISSRDFVYLFRDDIIFYQRPLKTKKSLIDNCPYEFTQYIDRETGEIKQAPVKCIARSNPLFQEFRLWQFIDNLRILQREIEVDGNLKTDADVTDEFLKDADDRVALFDWLNDRKEIDETSLLKSFFNLKKRAAEYRWNYPSDRTYPCNSTRALILSGLKKAGISTEGFDKDKEMSLWHILYSISDPVELTKALTKYAVRYHLADTFVEVFRKAKPFDREYGSYSAKAIKKRLPLMRMGKYWNFNDIDDHTKERIAKIAGGEISDWQMSDKVKAELLQHNSQNTFCGLSLYLACYVVYGRHSESKIITKWRTPEDISIFLRNQFRHGSLRNPIVEQIIIETLRVVQDIWKKLDAEGEKIDEIHLEMGSVMKQTAKEREHIAMQVAENEATNLRIKTMLSEFCDDPSYGVENVHPKSPSQQELFRIFEDDILSYNDTTAVDDVIKTFRSRKTPSKSDIIRYRLWVEQRYCAPYTGEIIPLSKLFTPAYEIEHIIPQARYFDDSFSNKVICESDVNKVKDKQTGYEFIKRSHGQKVDSGGHIFEEKAYEQFGKDHYRNSKAKMKRLLMDDIPDDFIARQMNDSRYIVNYIKTLLSNIVRDSISDNGEEFEREAISKNIIASNGQITDRLKKDWGINDIWNDIIYHRFERLNDITHSDAFGHWENKEGKRFFLTDMPLKLQPGFRKKRIDHRHHAMDAIIIACTTRNIVNYLNNSASLSDAEEKRPQLQAKVCVSINGGYKNMIKKPEGWTTFTQDVKASLLNIVVTFKQNLRIINSTVNNYQHYDASGHKVMVRQTKGDHWAIRKPMHKETVFGLVNMRRKKTVRLSAALKSPENIVEKQLRQKVRELITAFDGNMKMVEKTLKENASIWSYYDPAKIDIYYFTNDVPAERMVAVRKSVDTSFTEKVISEQITDTGIQKILLNHLQANDNKPELAFSPDGIDEMNRNITALNGGKPHQPILEVRKMELLGNKFNVGEKGNKSSKYVVAEKGTNLFFAVYANEDGRRVCDSVPLNIVIEREKEGLSPVPDTNEDGNKLLFYLTPNQLIYMPSEAEQAEGVNIENIDRSRIYKVVSFTNSRLYGIPSTVANVIFDKVEYTQLNKFESTDDKISIKSVCLPVKVDRLGNIEKIG